ncbi:MAG: hypothetical protein NT129_06640 [Candidatus Aenigmarchaeota archaeon]|nr:hypothetical protein [Candidatus Aenigmarchaeota archaeon]
MNRVKKILGYGAAVGGLLLASYLGAACEGKELTSCHGNQTMEGTIIDDGVYEIRKPTNVFPDSHEYFMKVESRDGETFVFGYSGSFSYVEEKLNALFNVGDKVKWCNDSKPDPNNPWY